VLSNDSPKKRDKKNSVDHIQQYTLALSGGTRFQMKLDSKIPYKANDLAQFKVTQAEGTQITLEPETLPPIEGAIVCIENNTGYVRALVGGLDFDRSRFNRAVQAMRQPGSAFKPIVYTAAFELGLYGPHSLVVDEPIAVHVSSQESEWIPMNSDGGFLGPITLRQALAQSRNVAAVKLIMDVGVEHTIEMARAMGIESRLGKNLSLSLGASEVTPLELTAAYTVFPNMGVRVRPVLVKKVVDRFGNVLEDNTMEPVNIAVVAIQPPRTLPSADAENSDDGGDQQVLGGQEFHSARELERSPEQDLTKSSRVESVLSETFPPLQVSRRPPPQRVVSPQTAYLMLSMLRQTCISGTGASVSRLRRQDLAGKTGTTDDCTDAWFIGFNPKYTTGVWMGYDAKVSLGQREFGNVAALPIWIDFMKQALEGMSIGGYPVPPGIVFWELRTPPQYSRLQDLLQAAPDFPPLSQIKAVCPVDEDLVALSYQYEPFGGRPVPASGLSYPMLDHFAQQALFSSGYPGMVRVLSPKGETLGHAYLATDERGRRTLWLDDIGPYGEAEQNVIRQDAWADSFPAGSDSLPSIGGRFSPGPGFFPPALDRFPRSPLHMPPRLYQDGLN
jgi:penicillin-binding protein 1A